MSIRNFVCEEIVLPISDLIKGEEVFKSLKFLKKSAGWSHVELETFQSQRLKQLIKYAEENVPYYHDMFTRLGIDAGEFSSIEDLKRLPIINKSIIRNEGIDRFSSKGFPRRKIMKNRSSGSTGEPFSYYTTKKAYSMNMAAKLYSWYKVGYRLGDRYMKIANGKRHGWLKRIQDRFNNCIYVPFYAMNQDDILKTLGIIEKKQPIFIRSYPTPIYQLASYRLKHPGFKYCPRMIMTTGSTLPESYRAIIEAGFGCKIMDSYSCEGNANAFECVGNHHYHVAQEYGITEILDKNNNPIQEGIGRIITTDLWNFAQPFIRYDTQDLAEIDNTVCPQNDKHKIIKRIIGRECESFTNSDGRVFTIHSFEGYFKDSSRPFKESIDAYQVVKMKDGSIRFKLVTNHQYRKEMSDYLADYWTQQFKVPVSVEVVDSIPIMNNNKRLTIVDET